MFYSRKNTIFKFFSILLAAQKSFSGEALVHKMKIPSIMAAPITEPWYIPLGTAAGQYAPIAVQAGGGVSILSS